jgi:hypothetical protein
VTVDRTSAAEAPYDLAVIPVECASCGQRLPPLSNYPGASCPSCGTGLCTPGQKQAYPYEAHGLVGRLFGTLYECLCCPDPCYEGVWLPEANAAYFVDWARPQTITRIRNDDGINLILPDRATYFWPRNDGKGIGPSPSKIVLHAKPVVVKPVTPVVVTPIPAGRPPGLTGQVISGVPSGRPFGLGTPTTTTARHPVARATTPKAQTVTLKGQPSVNYYDFRYYQEAATGRAAFFFEFPYREVEPFYGPTHAGFSDMNLGTKALIYDTEMLQLTFQFKTYLPLGNPLNGLGVGHVSLEPSFLSALKLTPSTFLQGQLSEWIPLGGDPIYSGSILHYHLSLNQVLHRFTPDSPLIGTMETNFWSFQDGAYTDPYRGTHKASGYTYVSTGPGLRLVICNTYDFGLGTAFAVIDQHWASTLYRLELRIRF